MLDKWIKHSENDKVKNRFHPEVMLDSFQYLLKHGSENDFKQLLHLFKQVQPFENSFWLDPKLFLSEHTFDLYLLGFTNSEIAKIRGVSRQSSSVRLELSLSKTEESLDSIEETHLKNRKIMKAISLGIVILMVEKEKDLSLMENVLKTKYKNLRIKYVTYVKLGGNPNVFSIVDVDKRFTPVTDSDSLSVFKCIKQGKGNVQIANELGIPYQKVLKLRKKLDKIENPLQII